MGWVPLACAWSTGSSVYLLDRVKPLDRLVDPADRAADPQRFAFVWSHASVLRRVNWVLFVVALASGLWLGWLAAGAVVLGHLSVLAYAHRPARLASGSGRATRVKDLFLLKNALVGTGMAVFALFLLWTSAGVVSLAAWWASLWVGSLISIDALVCDLDDAAADRAYGTATVASRCGLGVTRWTGGGAYAMLGLAVLLFGAQSAAEFLWVVGPLTGAAVIVSGVTPVRVLIDGRFALIGVVSLALMSA